MPYEWIRREPTELQPAELQLWPHRSLPRGGFVVFISVTALLLALPLLAAFGTAVFWGLLPFLVAAVAGVWIALSRSYRQAEMTEILRIWPDRIALSRRHPDQRELHWHANPYWATVSVYPSGGPVPHYLTLKGDDREVELGAFLSEDERKALAADVRAILAQLRLARP
ncbi:MAG: DUF2244 domain-containing protein [Rhodobacteraceae bacterium]|nr:DUF2244 domain-containing protein [Paracoccaceae bacterium]